MSARIGTLGSVLGAALLAGLPASAPAQGQIPLAARVNGEAITMQELDSLVNRDGPSAVQLTESKKREIRMGTLAAMVDALLLQQYLQKHGPEVKPAEVDKLYNELKTSLKRAGKSLEEFYRETGQTEAQLKAGIATRIQWPAFVQAHLSDENVKKYYDEYKDFFDGVGVRCSHIVLRVTPGAAAERQTAAAKLQELRQQIVAGTLDFAEAAKKHSQCPSAPQGGDLGVIPRKMMVDEAFARAAFALQPGQVSDVVQTEYGVHLIKAVERQPGKPSDFAKIKDDVRGFCIMEMRQMIIEQERKTAKIEVFLK